MDKKQEEDKQEQDEEIPVLLNDQGRPVYLLLDTYVRIRLYCGAIEEQVVGPDLFEDALPQRCQDVVQCQSCQRLQTGRCRVEILQRIFPALVSGAKKEDADAALIGALRIKGGALTQTVSYLAGELGVPHVEPIDLALGVPPKLWENEEDAGEFGLLASVFDDVNEENGVEEAIAVENAQQTRTAKKTNEIDVDCREAIRQASATPVPEAVWELVDSVRHFPCIQDELRKEADTRELEAKDPQVPFLVVKGHCMIRIMEDDQDQASLQVNCIHCAGLIPSQETGQYRCQACLVCEGCIQSAGGAFSCPKLLNGGRWHHHPLEYDNTHLLTSEVSGCSCLGPNDLCVQDSGVVWTCKECRFRVCADCIRKSPPDGYSRRSGKIEDQAALLESEADEGKEQVARIDGVVSANGSEEEHQQLQEEEEDQGGNENDQAFDEMSAERKAAAHWEWSYHEPVLGAVLVGSGEIGSTVPPTAAISPGRQLNAVPAVDRDINVRLSTEAQNALELFHYRHADRYRGMESVPATDLFLVEEILRRAQLVGDRFTSRTLQDAIASGKLEIAGTLLLSRAYAPRPASAKNGGDGNTCFCGEIIDETSAPDGAVGCFGGHAMHASCAADLLLSGGSCPSCRQPLYFPKFPGQEAAAALDIYLMEKEKQQKEKLREEFETMELQGLPFGLDTSYFVRISADVGTCIETQSVDPRSGGWADDMAEDCGKEGQVTDIITVGEQNKIVGIKVHTALPHILIPVSRDDAYTCNGCQNIGPSPETGRLQCLACSKCETCCQKSMEMFCHRRGNEWVWSPLLLTPIARVPETQKPEAKESVAEAAEKQLIRLRAELKAIQAAREAIKDNTTIGLKPLGSVVRGLSTNSSVAVRDLMGSVSHADWERARHLLLLARQWGDSKEAKAARAKLYSAVRNGELDSVARIVRRYNAARTAEEAMWVDAMQDAHEYIVQPTARVDLRAFPDPDAPRTGYSLGPQSLFCSKEEILDDEGNLWLKVDDKDFVHPSKYVGNVIADNTASMNRGALEGARVRRGPDWPRGDQDGGPGSEGVIIGAGEGYVVVRWDARPGEFEYQAGRGVFQLEFASSPPAPPQGWLCVRPGGHGSPPVVVRARHALRCFCCGDGLIPPRLGKERFSTVQGKTAKKGDRVFVAATLEPVIVSTVSDGQVFCTFPRDKTRSSRELDEPAIWYRPQDLVVSEVADNMDEDEFVMIQDMPRTRREMVILYSGEARRLWDEAKRKQREAAEEQVLGANFASCGRGHLLHARCLQGQLISGKRCPAPGCTEPLWVPKVIRQREDETSCGAHRRSRQLDLLEEKVVKAANELAGHSALVARRAAEGPSDDYGSTRRAGFSSLKMCPICCAGPLFNDNCGDMRAHHGECSFASFRNEGTCTPNGIFSVSPREIADSLARMSLNTSVADVLPRCPTHDVLVVFNGCMACGHLFTDTSWYDLPDWDENAKALLELDREKRKAAELLVAQIRKEAALLQFERDVNDKQYLELERKGAGESVLKDLPPPPPSVHKYLPRHCGPECTRDHYGDGDCLVCGRDYGDHTSHICWEGTRGRWMIDG